MWPDLPEGPSRLFIDWASRDERKVNDRAEALPTRGVYSGSAGMTEYVEGDTGLWALRPRLSQFVIYPDKVCNVLYYIQVAAWKVTNPLIKSDFNAARDVLFKMRTARVPLDDDKFKKWVENFRLLGQLSPFHVLGEVTELKAKPSILLATRLYDLVNRRGTKR